MASAVGDNCVELMEKQKTEDSEALNVRAKALKGLIELAKGNIESGSAEVYLFNWLLQLLMCANYMPGAVEAFFDKSLRSKLCDGIFLFMCYSLASRCSSTPY